MEVLKTKQKELESDEHLYSILKGKRRKAVPKGASEKKKSKINLIKDATDSELGSSDSEEAPQKVCRLRMCWAWVYMHLSSCAVQSSVLVYAWLH